MTTVLRVELPDVGKRLEQRAYIAHAPISSCRVVGVDCHVLVERSEKKTSVSAPSPGQSHLVLDLRGPRRRRRAPARRRRSPRRPTHTRMPSIAMSTAAAVEPLARQPSAAPTACTIRPQFGSPPCSAAFTSGELATARAAPRRSAVPAADDHPGDPSGALAVGDHHDRELAQQRVERLAEAQLVLALGRDRHAAGARAHQDRGVVGRQLPVDRGAVEGALHAHSEQQVGRLGRQRGVGLDEAQHRRERAARSSRRPCTGRSGVPGPTAARPRGSRASRRRRSSGSPAGSRRRRPRSAGGVASRMPLQHRVDRQLVADAAGRGERDLGRVRRPRRSRRRPGSLRRRRGPRWPVAALAHPELASTARSAPSRQRSRLSSTGAAGVPVEVKRAALTGPSASHTSRPRSGLPLGLIPQATPAARKPAGSPASGAEVAHMRGRAAPSASERRARAAPLTRGPRPRRNPNITLRFWTACEEVPFQRLSIAESTTTLPVCASAAAKTGRSWSRAPRACPAARSATSTNGSRA